MITVGAEDLQDVVNKFKVIQSIAYCGIAGRHRLYRSAFSGVHTHTFPTGCRQERGS